MADVTTPFGFPYPEDTDLVRDGASDIENLAEGVNDYLTGGYLYAGTRYYTSSGTFLKADPLGTGPIGLRAIRVRMVGGGGGGAGMTDAESAGGGGGGGGYAESFITDIASLPGSVDVTRGSGGPGGTGKANGTAGGASSFDTLVVGNGGGQGFADNTTAVNQAFPGTGGSGTGDVVFEGGDGSPPPPQGQSRLSYGGASHLGGQRATPTPLNFGGDSGREGRQYGGGGSGASRRAAGSTNGAAGANGIVIIDCFV
jgi:hypothetical protein